MSTRSPQNERNTNPDAKPGYMRKSAASAKPARSAASSVRVVPAFLAEETTAVLALRGHVWPIRLVWAGLCALASFIKSVVKLRAGNPAVSREEIGHGKECTERARRVDGKNS